MSIILFLVILLILITVHELGHFMFAKLFNVYVTEFALGFGPKIFSKKGKETEFSIRILPLGGYAAMVGEEGEIDEKYANIPFERTVKGVNRFKQFWIMFGGSLMNIILGLLLFVGLAFSTDNINPKPIIGEVIANSPAQKAGLKKNDYVKSIVLDGKVDKINSYTELQLFSMKNKEGKSYQMNVIRDNKNITLNITPYFDKETNRYIAGFQPSILYADHNIFYAFKNGIDLSIGVCKDVFLSLQMLLTGQAKLDDVSGPVGMVSLTSQISQSSGFVGLVKFTGLLSINLAIFNLLPIPALDGGRILIILIESIFRRRLNPKVESAIIGGSFILLFGLIIIVTFNDITKLFR
ncbi:MAG: RIP metalloprotease RseP [Bacilli bacterium]|jgi:regulator of sigma E protease|nr:RIP metalloprotease RseP [Bacilli bacterium]